MSNDLNSQVLASNDFPYVLFEVGENICGVTCSKMLSIQILGHCTPMVNSPDYVRGCMNFRGTFIPLVDIRKMTDQITLSDNIDHNINIKQRIHDHEHWINTLEQSVISGTPFTLTGDPHMCAFGKWYYSFKTDNNLLQNLLKAIEAPHNELHKTAAKVKDILNQKNGKELALEEIDYTKRHCVAEVIRLLEQVDSKLREAIKEMLVVVETNDGAKGLIVDHVVGVEEIESFEPVPAHLSHSDHVTCIGRREKTQEAILIFDCDQIK